MRAVKALPHDVANVHQFCTYSLNIDLHSIWIISNYIYHVCVLWYLLMLAYVCHIVWRRLYTVISSVYLKVCIHWQRHMSNENLKMFMITIFGMELESGTLFIETDDFTSLETAKEKSSQNWNWDTQVRWKVAFIFQFYVISR